MDGNYCPGVPRDSFQPRQILDLFIFSDGWIPRKWVSRTTWLAVRDVNPLRSMHRVTVHRSAKEVAQREQNISAPGYAAGTDLSPVPSELGRRRARRAARTPWNAVCERTLSIGSKWGRTPSQIGFSHRLWRKPTPAIARHSFHQALGPRPLIRFLHTLQDFVQCHNSIFEVLFPECKSCLVPPGCCLHPLDRSIILPNPWLPSIFQRAFAFCPS